MKALVLGGGSMKGAFQVGCIKAILESGFAPDRIYGISVGSLNSSYLVNECGRQFTENRALDWPQIGRKLLEFWIKNIRTPQDVALLRSRMTLGFNTLMSRFDGLLDPSPLHGLVQNTLTRENLLASPVKLMVSAVNVMDGHIVDATPEHPDFIKYMLASSAIPMLMPAIAIGDEGQMYLDGGLRQVVPVRQAAADGATEIMVVACHTRGIKDQDKFSPRNFISLLERVREVTVNQLENNDLDWIQGYSERAGLRGQPVKLTVIRPDEPILLNLQSFNSEDISRLIVDGYKTALNQIRKNEKENIAGLRT